MESNTFHGKRLSGQIPAHAGAAGCDTKGEQVISRMDRSWIRRGYHADFGGSESDKMKVLIVEDSPSDKMLLKEALRRLVPNVEIVGAPTGEEGIKKFRGGDFDVVITDLKMPGITGYEVCRAVRAIDKDILLIILTGSINLIDNKHAYDCGADFLIIKHVDFFKLVDSLEKVFSGLLKTKQQCLQ